MRRAPATCRKEQKEPFRAKSRKVVDVREGSNTSFCACVDHFRVFADKRTITEAVGTSDLTHVAAGFFIRPLPRHSVHFGG